MTDVLDLARAQLEAGGAHANRRACWLARTAMEECLDGLLDAKDLDVGALASTRSKLACLEVAYAGQPEVAARAQYVWTRLSEACHQHAYQLSPTYGEARDLIVTVATLLEVESADH